MSFCEADDADNDRDDQRALWAAIIKLTERVARLEAQAGIRKGGNAYDPNAYRPKKGKR